VVDRLPRRAERNMHSTGRADPKTRSTNWIAAAKLERHLIRTARPNLLLIGMEQDTGEVLKEFRSDFVEPITTWSPGTRLVLPAYAQAGTFILDDITALGFDDQIRLLDWLGASDGRVQVVSVASRSVAPLIETGTFLSMLYYRLNVVCLDLTGRERRAHRTG
jgi:hypothetical protein